MPPTTGDGADKNGRNSDSGYRREEGRVCGQIKVVTGWHAIGHPVSPCVRLRIFSRGLVCCQNDSPVPSSSILASGRKFAASMKALSEFRIVAKRLNGVLDLLDPGAAHQYKLLKDIAMKKLDYLRAIGTVDPSYWQGRVILFNRQTPPHRDTLNPPAEWTPLQAAGSFTDGGSLYIHDLNLRLRYLPGDLIFLRGCLLKHSVEPWEGDQRISAAYFSHESFWRYFGQRLSVTPTDLGPGIEAERSLEDSRDGSAPNKRKRTGLEGRLRSKRVR